MAEELHNARKLLRTAIDRYLDACSNFRDSYIHEIVSKGAPVELADTANNELQRALSFDSKLKQSIAAISLVRNTAPTTVPINSLPSEILTLIFQLVLDPGPPPLYMPMKLLPQDVLSHVCTHWRRVATSSRPFWSQIDFGLRTARFDRHLSRAKTYATRANPSPLDIRISLHDLALRAKTSAQTSLAELINFIAPQIRSLQFHANGELTGLHRLLMETCLAAATPGTLSTLVISVLEDSNERHHFIDSVESSDTNRRLLLNVSQERLEAVLLSVQVLWVNELYPYWTSKAYRGLTELRIDADSWVSITESQLENMLVACPKLRTLIFRCEISNPRSRSNSTMPVRLAELESLSLCVTGGNEERDSGIEILLRLLAPGLKPFSLAITGGANLDRRMLDSSVREFLSRTNVTKMSLAGVGTYLVTSEMLCSIPSLRELSLEGVDIGRNNLPAESNTNTLSSPGLVSLSLLNCAIKLDVLRQLVESMKIRSLSVWDCFPSGAHGTQDVSEETLRAALSDLCSVTRAAEPKDFHDERMEWEQWPRGYWEN